MCYSLLTRATNYCRRTSGIALVTLVIQATAYLLLQLLPQPTRYCHSLRTTAATYPLLLQPAAAYPLLPQHNRYCRYCHSLPATAAVCATARPMLLLLQPLFVPLLPSCYCCYCHLIPTPSQPCRVYSPEPPCYCLLATALPCYSATAPPAIRPLPSRPF